MPSATQLATSGSVTSSKTLATAPTEGDACPAELSLPLKLVASLTRLLLLLNWCVSERLELLLALSWCVSERLEELARSSWELVLEIR